VDLIREHKVEVQSQGSGIQSVHLHVRRLADYPITVVVPVGTYIVSKNPGSQNMVATAEVRHTLATQSWVDLYSPAACANRPSHLQVNPPSGPAWKRRASPRKIQTLSVNCYTERHGRPGTGLGQTRRQV